MWSYQIWFVSKIVTAQCSGDCCDKIASRTLNCSAGIAWVHHRIFCLVRLGLLNLHRLNVWGEGCMKHGHGAVEAVWLNILLLLSFHLVTVFQVTAFRDPLTPISSVLCPTYLSYSSVASIDFLLQVKIEVDISYTVWSRRDRDKRMPGELPWCSKFQSAYPFPGKLKAQS